MTQVGRGPPKQSPSFFKYNLAAAVWLSMVGPTDILEATVLIDPNSGKQRMIVWLDHPEEKKGTCRQMPARLQNPSLSDETWHTSHVCVSTDC